VFFDNFAVMKSKNRLKNAFSIQEIAQSAKQLAVYAAFLMLMTGRCFLSLRPEIGVQV